MNIKLYDKEKVEYTDDIIASTEAMMAGIEHLNNRLDLSVSAESLQLDNKIYLDSTKLKYDISEIRPGTESFFSKIIGFIKKILDSIIKFIKGILKFIVDLVKKVFKFIARLFKDEESSGGGIGGSRREIDERIERKKEELVNEIDEVIEKADHNEDVQDLINPLLNRVREAIITELKDNPTILNFLEDGRLVPNSFIRYTAGINIGLENVIHFNEDYLHAVILNPYAEFYNKEHLDNFSNLFMELLRTYDAYIFEDSNGTLDDSPGIYEIFQTGAFNALDNFLEYLTRFKDNMENIINAGNIEMSEAIHNQELFERLRENEDEVGGVIYLSGSKVVISSIIIDNDKWSEFERAYNELVNAMTSSEITITPEQVLVSASNILKISTSIITYKIYLKDVSFEDFGYNENQLGDLLDLDMIEYDDAETILRTIGLIFINVTTRLKENIKRIHKNVENELEYSRTIVSDLYSITDTIEDFIKKVVTISNLNNEIVTDVKAASINIGKFYKDMFNKKTKLLEGYLKLLTDQSVTINRYSVFNLEESLNTYHNHGVGIAALGYYIWRYKRLETIFYSRHRT